jgi:hypothetical protein
MADSTAPTAESAPTSQVNSRYERSRVKETGARYHSLAHAAALRDFHSAYPLQVPSVEGSSGQEPATDIHSVPSPENQKSETFEYEPLGDPSGFLRLLSVKPSTLSTDILECRMTTVPIEDLHQHVALSYVWGVAMSQTAILCNGKRIGVTPNLVAALKTYRTTRKAAE